MSDATWEYQWGPLANTFMHMPARETGSALGGDIKPYMKLCTCHRTKIKKSDIYTHENRGYTSILLARQ